VTESLTDSLRRPDRLRVRPPDSDSPSQAEGVRPAGGREALGPPGSLRQGLRLQRLRVPVPAFKLAGAQASRCQAGCGRLPVIPSHCTATVRRHVALSTRLVPA